MTYRVNLSASARKDIKKLDRHQAKLIISWLEKKIDGCTNPRLYGAALTGDKSGYWRYRVGAYRIIAEIQDDVIRIEIINVGHRSNIYN